MSGKRDWEALEAAYVSGCLTLEGFAQAHGIPYDTVAKQAAKRKWQAKRQANGKAVASMALSLANDEAADELAAQNRRDVAAAAALHNKVCELIGVAESARDVRALAGALKDAQAVARLALGAATENGNVKVSLDFEEWLHERAARGD